MSTPRGSKTATVNCQLLVVVLVLFIHFARMNSVNWYYFSNSWSLILCRWYWSRKGLCLSVFLVFGGKFVTENVFSSALPVYLPRLSTVYEICAVQWQEFITFSRGLHFSCEI
jgi:hypothetical protein